MSQMEEPLPKSKNDRKRSLLKLLQAAAIKLRQEGDPWKKYSLQEIPAERVVRHLYDPISQTWSTDETIVKIENEPFTHGAMRYCYRMKKRSTPPSDATNHHFHKINWSYASNYVAKAYIKANSNGEAVIDTSQDAKKNVRNDIMLQFEAQYWANKFNQQNPPKTIHFLRAYAIEFPDRPGQPWFAVERFITGTDMYGAGYVKHNTNSGYVDKELRRITPQIFSAFSFYASSGHRLVADIQGIGDLYTDPQVLSSDYRFGDGDLGPRGMAFFMTHFRNCTSSDALGIPIFPLSKNEIKYHQTKYDDDEVTLSDEDSDGTDDDSLIEKHVLDQFQKLDLNRRRRSTLLQQPTIQLDSIPLSRKDTMRRANLSKKISTPIALSTSPPPRIHRTRSDVDDIKICIEKAKVDHVFTHHDFHRHASGELKLRHYKSAVATTSDESVAESSATSKNNNERQLRSTMVLHKGALVRSGEIAKPILITADTRMNLGRVHYQLAVLHGLGRFPEVSPQQHIIHNLDATEYEDKYNHTVDSAPEHDAYTVLFHLSHGASLHNAPSCLALGRVLAGLTTQVSFLLSHILSIDFESSKALLRRTMTSPSPTSKPKVAAGCLLYQILRDEQRSIQIQIDVDCDADKNIIAKVCNGTSNLKREMLNVLEDSIQLMQELEKEDREVQQYKKKQLGGIGLMVGDHVEANYALEGTFYPAVIEEIIADQGSDKQYIVKYDDDNTCETLSSQNIRARVPPTATQSSLGGPLSDEKAFNSSCDETDDAIPMKQYELQLELAQIKEEMKDYKAASILYENAADGAIADGKMKSATSWSLKAAELLQEDQK